MPERIPDPGDSGRYFAFGLVGLEMVVPVAVGLFLDRNLGWAPWGVVGGTVLGLVGGLFHLVMLARKFDRDEKLDRGKSSGKPRDET